MYFQALFDTKRLRIASLNILCLAYADVVGIQLISYEKNCIEFTKKEKVILLCWLRGCFFHQICNIYCHSFNKH